MMDIAYKIMREGAKAPFYATAGAAAADLCAICAEEGVTIAPGEHKIVPTGIAIELPCAEAVALLFARSGLSIKHGIAISNGVGVIDSDYRGEICVSLVNTSAVPYTIANGERIAQLAIMPVFSAQFIRADALSTTARGHGGLGSTGK